MTQNQTSLEIIDTNGESQQVEVVMSFESDITKKQYVVYTKNEKKENDMVVLYASAMTKRDHKIILEDISDEEWLFIKNKMRDIMHNEGGSH